MNFLSHIVLAKFGKQQIGAFIADAVKGNKYQQYNTKIQLGILQHRFVDSYTDNHSEVAKVTALFRPKYGKYAGVVTDVVFDYFLLQNWSKFQNIPLRRFMFYFYINIILNYIIFPKRMKRFAKVVVFNNLTASYKSVKGIANILNLMSKYRGIPNESYFVELVINENYEMINEIFINFFYNLRTEAELFLTKKATNKVASKV